MSGERSVLEGFFRHLLTIKMFHFQTKSGFRHLKVDDHMTAFLEKLDRFFEVWQGEFAKLSVKELKVEIKTKTDVDFHSYLDSFADWLLSPMSEEWPATVSGIRDDIVADVRKLQYLIKDFQ